MPRRDDPHPYIHRMAASGMPDALIFQRLILEGWAKADVAPIFAARGLPAAIEATEGAPRAADSPKTVSTGSKKILKHASVFGIFVVLFAIGAASTSTYLYLKPPVVYSISLPSSEATGTPALTYGALPALADPGYYESITKKLVDEKASFINANLSSMELEVYIEGNVELKVPILAKGKVGSWWETPAGIYKIQTKEKNHFSSFGHVYQPYSLDFQGNFFIHGWPYYEDGTQVSSSYSGGCIRLSTEDAKKVYDLASVGMPVVVYNTEHTGDSFNYQLKAPAVTAQEYLVADIKNGTVLTSKNASQAAAIASITKLVTALVATEYINLDKTIAVPKRALVYTSIPRLKAGQEIRAYDLLYLLLQESSNEAAETFAAATGREIFINHMNEKARAIGLSRTLFTDPSGAKSDLSTPEDLFLLLRYIMENRRFVFGITAGVLTDTAYGEPAFSNIQNFNVVKKASGELLGGKIGQTNEAGETYAGIFKVTIGGQERDLAVIVLGSRDSQSDVKQLLNFVRNSYAPGEIGQQL